MYQLVSNANNIREAISKPLFDVATLARSWRIKHFARGLASVATAFQGALLFTMIAVGSRQAPAVEHVSLSRDDKPIHLTGKVLVEAEDGGLLLEDLQGVLWAIQPDEITNRKSDNKPFEPLDADGLIKEMNKELPGFRIHKTAHYLIYYNTSQPYAQWCGALYERLYAGFQNYWTKRGVELHEPAAPLVALVFDSKKAYSQYARTELGEATAAIIGYYSLRTNRVTMYDLTGADGVSAGLRGSSAKHVNRILSQPAAERTVATIIHEATHQLAFNCGLQARYADIPLWVSEGIAVYFETPDLNSTRGWRRIGAVNQVRLAEFRQYLKNRPSDSLTTLLSDDQRFRQVRAATDAYAEAWALNYYLINRHGEAYIQYTKMLAKKEPLQPVDAEGRLKEFKAAFGDDLEKLDSDFLRQMNRLK